MSNPRNGFCSGNFVGDGLNLSNLVSDSRVGDSDSGDIGGDTLPARLKLMLSSKYFQN